MDSGDPSKGQEESTATLLFCRMCQAVYRQPKILPCLHSFCRPCLVNAVSHTALRGTVIVCPLCSNEARLPPNGIVGVPDNGFLNRLCQEYISEVQSHLVSRSLHSGAGLLTSPRPSEFSALRTRLSDELTHPKFSPSTSPNRSVSSRPSSVSSSTDDQAESGAGDVFSERGPATGKSTSGGALEAIRNMSRIQAKIMSLQGEALRVTYTIDNVNQSMIEWHQHKEDTKRAVQRRAAQYQFYIKRLEHQLISQIDSKSNDDSFYAESDKSKTELRKNLKNILHEVSVLKIIQERGKDPEINALSASLLGKSVGMSDVSLLKFQYDLNVPTKSIEEIVNDNFGKISLVKEGVPVFNPEIVDFTQMVLGSSPSAATVAEEDDVQTDQRTETFTEEDIEEEFRRSKRRTNEKRSRRHNTDLGLNTTDVQDYLAQFQTARETFRNRRREILLQGQQTREDASPVRHEIRPRPRSSSRNGRVQSLDRSAMPVTRGRSSLPGLITNRPDDPDTMITSQYVTSIRPNDISLPSPVIEEASVPSSPIRSLVKQVSDPRYNQPVTSPPSSNISTPILENQILDQDEKLSSSAHSSRRHSSDLLSPLAPHGRSSLDILDRSSRPVRRALSAAGDRKSKMEFLRENWQRRKEILIQSEGFVSPESQQIKAAVKPGGIRSPPVSPVLQNITNRAEGSPLSPRARELSALSPPISPDIDPKLGPMHQLRSRLSHFRQIIGGNGSTKSKDEVGKSPEVDQQPVDRHEVRIPSAASARAVSPIPRTVSSKPAFTTVSQVNAETTESLTTVTTSTLAEPMKTSTLTSTQQTATTMGPKTSAPAAATPSPSTLSPATITTSSTTTTSTATTSAANLSSPTVTTASQTPTTTTGYVSRYGLSTSSYTSRYAKTYTKPTESFDAAAMIAAMYRGNEKSIIGSKEKTTTDTSTTSSTTTSSTTTSSTTTMTSSTITTNTKPSIASVPSPVTSTPATTATTSSMTDTISSPSLYTGRVYSRYSTGRNYSQDSAITTTSEVTTTASATSPVSLSFASSVTSKTQNESSNAFPRLSGTYQSPVGSAASDAAVHSGGTSSVEPAATATPDSASPQPSPSTATTANPDVSPSGVAPGVPKPKFESRRSRYSGQGFNRRHTIEVGKSDIEAALALQSNPQSFSLTQNTASSLPPVIETDQHDDLTSITFHSGQRRAMGRFVPAPLNLEPLREVEAAEQHSPAKTPSALSAAVAAMKSPSLSPTSPESGNLKAKLRDIARKKKERWRHLTIH